MRRACVARTAAAYRLVASLDRFPSRRRAAPVDCGIVRRLGTDCGIVRRLGTPCACVRPQRAPCVPALCARCGPLCVPALRTSVCPCCVRGVLVRFVVGVCVPGPLPAARARAVRARAVRLRAGCVVCLCSARLDRAAFARQRRRHHGGAPARALCWQCMLALCALAPPMLALRVPAVRALALHACVVRTCASHARVACTCCACPRCACPRRAPSCWACGVLVQRSPTSCDARRHLIPRRPRRPDMSFTYSQSHGIALVMNCSSLFALSCLCCPSSSLFQL